MPQTVGFDLGAFEVPKEAVEKTLRKIKASYESSKAHRIDVVIGKILSKAEIIDGLSRGIRTHCLGRPEDSVDQSASKAPDHTDSVLDGWAMTLEYLSQVQDVTLENLLKVSSDGFGIGGDKA